MDKQTLLTLTSDIVASHASANELSQGELLGEIDQVFRKLASLAGAEGMEPSIAGELPPEEEAEITPAVPLEAAFGAEKVFCMACGKGMKTLKRHLSTAHDLKPGQYRRKRRWPRISTWPQGSRRRGLREGRRRKSAESPARNCQTHGEFWVRREESFGGDATTSSSGCLVGYTTIYCIYSAV
jgi:predicted transcriptional regulator